MSQKRYKSIKSFWSDHGANEKSQKSSSTSSPLSAAPMEGGDNFVDTSCSSIPIEDTSESGTKQNDVTMDFRTESVYDVDFIPHDPEKRVPISSYLSKDQDTVRRKYVALGPCQPRHHNCPQRQIGGKQRRFVTAWFDTYKWLEYSVEKDAAFCFVCYLFKDKTNCASGDIFVKEGLTSWHKPDKFVKHIGGIGSAHNQAQEKYDLFKNQKTSIIVAMDKQSGVSQKQATEAEKLYLSRLTYSLKCLRYLLHQGLSCRGHDESEESENRGNFLELLKWLAGINEDVAKVVLGNAPKNCQMISPLIQNDIINSCAKATTQRIIDDLGDDYFGILADESSDVADKEQMALCLRYVNKEGRLCERFLGIVHVENTTALTLKDAIESLLISHSLSLSRIRGQCYDGASNMKGEINGLKTLIMKESPSAYYVHCFAHQLQLTLVAVAKDNDDCAWLFNQLNNLLNIIGVSCKRKEMIRFVQAQNLLKKMEEGEVETGKGLNQELGLARPGETRWGSHYKTILNVISLYPTIMEVLMIIGTTASKSDDRNKAQTMMTAFESYDFVFMTQLMLHIFGFTDDLSNALQRKDQNIITAMGLVITTKEELQKLRDSGYEKFVEKVATFCQKHNIEVPDDNQRYAPPGRSQCFFPNVTNIHRFRVEMFLGVIDLQLQELNNRFDEVNMELLTCMGHLNPANSFASFNVDKVVRLAEFYLNDFSPTDLMRLGFQLQVCIADLRSDDRFHHVTDLAELAYMLVQTDKHNTYKLVYLLIKLVLILPVATASVERVFSGMDFVKNKLRNSMGDQRLHDCLVTFIEKDFFSKVSDAEIIVLFLNMKTRRYY